MSLSIIAVVIALIALAVSVWSYFATCRMREEIDDRLPADAGDFRPRPRNFDDELIS